MTNAALRSTWVQAEVNAALHQVNIGRMRGVIPIMMTRCDDAVIPPLWAQLHRYDATQDYETAREGLLRAMGLAQGGVNQQDRRLDVARLKTLDGLLSLTPREFEDAVTLLLTATGYRDVGRPPKDHISDLRCHTLHGRRVRVWCKAYRPNHPIGVGELRTAIGLAASTRDDPWRLIYVTLSDYTGEAKTEANRYGDQIRLLDGGQVVSMMQFVQPE